VSTTSRLDAAALAPLRALAAQTGKDLLGKVIDAYCDSAPKLLAEIASSIAADDAETLRRAAHTLKSSSASLGALELAALAKALELRAREGTTRGARELAAPLAAEAKAVMEELRQLRKAPR
jgi:HPt (histidine-containing phosphotransfer) domain-containing protein